MANIMRLGGGSGGNSKYFWNKYEAIPLLPDGYTAVEYIESIGAQHIDTGFIPNQNSTMLLDFYPTVSQSACFAGTRVTSSSRGFMINSGSSGTKQYGAMGSSGNVELGAFSVGRHTASIQNGLFTYDGVQTVVSADTIGTFTARQSLYLFACNNGSAELVSTCRIYSCKVYDNGALVRDYVPCVDASGTAGMYDRANDAFYTNDGTGAFIAGNVVSGFVKGDFIGSVGSTNIGAYPDGNEQGGYFYEAIGEEIAITKNGVHDVRAYVTANVDVNTPPVLLWTNASPTSAFGAQTMAVNGTGYDAYLVECKYITSQAGTGIGLIPFSTNEQVIGASAPKGGHTVRRVLSATNQNIVFSDAYSSSGSPNSQYAIPTRIWGVKFTL